MNEATVYEGLTQILQDVFARGDLVAAPDLAAKDVDGWDSFKQIEILVSTEELFGVKFRTREIDAIENIGGLANLVLNKIAERG